MSFKSIFLNDFMNELTNMLNGHLNKWLLFIITLFFQDNFDTAIFHNERLHTIVELKSFLNTRELLLLIIIKNTLSK